MIRYCCSHRLIKVRQVNSYIIQFLNRKFSPCLVEMPGSKFGFYLDIMNILIIFMQNRYIKVFDLTNPRYNEHISSVPW